MNIRVGKEIGVEEKGRGGKRKDRKRDDRKRDLGVGVRDKSS